MEEIIRHLIRKQNTFIGEAPFEIDNCQWVVPISGVSDDHFGKDTYDKPEYKIYVRNNSNEAAREIMDEIYHKLKNYVGANYVIIVDRLPYYVNRDIKYRCLYALKIEIQLGGY